MFRVILEDSDHVIQRCDIMSWKKENMYGPTRAFSSFNPTTMTTSTFRPIDSYVVTLRLNDYSNDYVYLYINQESDVNDLINKLILAEEEQLTTRSVSMDELNTYMAEKMIGNTHDAVPGVRISKINFNGVFTTKEIIEEKLTPSNGGIGYGYNYNDDLRNTSICSSSDTGTITLSKGGSKYGI